MKTLMTKRRFLASFLSIVMLLSVLLSGAVFTRAESTNLREHIEEVKGIARPVGNDWWRQEGGDLITDEKAATLFDGDITNQVFIRSALDWENPLESGVYVKLDQPYYVEKIVLHSGAVGYPETLSVYATTEDKIFPPNGALSSMLVAEGIACENHKEPVTVKIGMELQYLAIFSTSGEWRPYEIEIHQKGDVQTPDEGGDEPESSEPDSSEDETPVNLLDDHMSSIKSVSQNKETGAVTDSTAFNNVLEILTDGNTTTRKDVNGLDVYIKDVKNGTANVGVQISLDKAYTLSKIALYEGISSHPDYVKIYASEKLEDLYKEASLIADEVELKGLAEIDTTLKAKHIAILVTETTQYGIARPCEYQIMGLLSSGIEIEEDLGGGEEDTTNGINLRNYFGEVTGLLQIISNGTVAADNRFSKEACDAIHDGVTNVHKDVYHAMDWEVPRYVGVRIALFAPIEVEKLVLHSGLPGYSDVLKIYASDSLGNLYDASNLIAEGVTCNGEAQSVKIEKKIQYVAIFATDAETWRPKEFELYAAEDTQLPEIVEAENLLPDHLESAQSILQNIATGDVTLDTANDRFNINGALDTICDGDTNKHVDVYGAKDWEVPRYVGVLLTLDDVYDVGNIKLYSGLPQYTDGLRVYASNNLSDLYTYDNMLADGIECSGEAVTVVAAKKVRYVAILITEYVSAGRVREFEVYTATGYEVAPDGPVGPGSSGGSGGSGNQGGETPSTSTQLTGSAIAQVNGVARPVGNDWWRQEGGDLITDEKAATLFDGDINNQVFIRSALDWENPLESGISVKLDKPYYIDKIVLHSGVSGYPETLSVYTNTEDKIFPPDGALSSMLVAENIACEDHKKPVTVKIGKEVQYLAIFSTGGEWRPYEIEIHQGTAGEGPDDGGDTPDNPPSGSTGNILLGLGEPNKIGVTTGTDYDAASGTGGNNNAGLVDGIINDPVTGKKQDVQFWNGKAEGSKFVFVYDLGKNYDLTKVSVYAKEDYLSEEVHQGIKSWDFYASATRGDLFQDASKVTGKTGYADAADKSIDVSFQQARYVALVVAIEDTLYGACRISEWEVYGTLSAEQDEGGGPVITPDGHENLLTNMAPDLFGVTAGNDYETLDGTDGPHGFEGLTDGLFEEEDDNGNTIKQNVQFWNGKSEDGTLKKFVFTYDLVKNYDLSKVAVFAWENYQDEGVNQGIESWTLYASRTREDLFKNESKITGKNGYADPADLELALSLKQIRFVSFVFTIQDTRYGACRLTELELYGVESAEQDSDKPVEALPEYRDFVTESGAVIRILALDETDNLSKLDVKAAVKKITTAADLRAVEEKLDNRYYAKVLYQISLTDANGDDVDLGNRVVRLLMPVNSANYLVAVVDVIGVDLINAKYVDGHMMIDAVNNNTYALVTTSGEAGGSDDTGSDNTGSDDSNTGNGGSDDNTPGSPATGVTGVAGVVLLAVLAATVMVYTKKAKRA